MTFESPTPDPAPQRVLIVRPTALGDVCRTVPVLASLRRAWPEAVIDWVVRDVYVPAISAHPDVSEVIPFPRSRFGACWRNPRVAAEAGRWFRALRRRRYDIVLDCQGLGRSGLITRATGAPRRVGYRTAREFATLAYTHRVPHDADTHTVDAMLSLVAAVGVEPVADMRLYVSSDDREWWRQECARQSIDRYAVLAATARWETKRWPEARWRSIAEHLVARGYTRLVLVGGPGEESQVRDLASLDGVTSHVGSITIGQTIAIIADAALVVAHDSAPLHIAVGFDRPCVGLFGPTDPALVGPYGRPDAVVHDGSSVPAGHYRDRRIGDSMMRTISVDQVLKRIDAVELTARRDSDTGAETPARSAITEGTSP